MHELIVIITSFDKFKALLEIGLNSGLLIKRGDLPQVVFLAQLKMIIHIIHYILSNLREQVGDLVGHFRWYYILKHLQVLAKT